MNIVAVFQTVYCCGLTGGQDAIQETPCIYYSLLLPAAATYLALSSGASLCNVEVPTTTELKHNLS